MDEDALQQHVVWATLVGELSATPPSPEAGFLPEHVRDAVNLATQRLCVGNGAALEGLFGVPKNTVWEWRAGAARPQLSRLLRLAQVLGISLRQLVLGPLPAGDAPASDGWRKSVPVWRGSPEGGRQAATRGWEPVRQALCNEVASSATQGAPASLRAVAARVGIPARSVYRRFPELARAISTAHHAERTARGRRRLAQRSREVAAAIRRIRAGGRPVTSRRFRRVYIKAGYLRDPAVRDAFRAAVSQQQ